MIKVKKARCFVSHTITKLDSVWFKCVEEQQHFGLESLADIPWSIDLLQGGANQRCPKCRALPADLREIGCGSTAEIPLNVVGFDPEFQDVRAIEDLGREHVSGLVNIDRSDNKEI